MRNIFMTAFTLLVLSSFLIAAPTDDLKGSKDHPLITRFPGSIIRDYKQVKFDRYTLRLSPVQAGGKMATSQPLEGTVTQIVYIQPKDRSTLEVFRNYQQALLGAGFASLYSCELDGCGTGIGKSYPGGLVGFVNSFDAEQRYEAFKRTDAESEVYVALYAVKTHDGPFVRVDIIEVAAMQTGLVKVTAAKMKSEIEAKGKTIVEQIFFESGKATLKPESNEAISEIAKLLTSEPSLKLFVVGHTDNTGGYDVNVTLSQERADAVVAALTGTHKIAKERVIPKGVAYLAPQADNASEAGKAKNRRVELVPQ